VISFIKTNPIVKIESKTISSLRGSRIDKVLDRYKLKLLYEQEYDEVIPSFQEIINKINYSVLKPPNRPWEINYSFGKSSGTTKVFLNNEYDPKRPTLVFHHGLASRNQLHLKLFLNDEILEKSNVFSIRASNHESTLAVLKNCINNFTNLATTTCASVLAADEIVDFHKNNSTKPIILVGFSLGGTVASLHYYFFNAADHYFPILAFPDFGKIIMHKSHKSFIYNYNKLSKNKSLINCFNIPEQLKKRNNKNKVFPIIGKQDELVNYKDASKFWKGYKVKTFDVGHYTIVLKINEVRKYIMSNISI
jgi:predicted esterase